MKLAIEAQPGYWLPHNYFGTFLRRQGRNEEAVAQFERVRELVPDQAIGHVNLATTLSRLGEFERALALYEQSLAIEETRAAYSNIGLAHYRLGQFDDAANNFRAAMEIAPDDYRGWGRLGNALRHAGDTEGATDAYRQALALCETAISINPNSPALLAARGGFNVFLGATDGAESDLERALELAPSSPSLHTHVASIYLALGDREQALELVQRAVELGESVHMLEVDPDLAGLREEPKFSQLLPRRQR